MRNAYSYGQNEPGGAVARAEDFPLLTTALPARPRPRVARLADFADSETKGPGYLVKGLLQRRSYAEVYGAPGEGKTWTKPAVQMLAEKTLAQEAKSSKGYSAKQLKGRNMANAIVRLFELQAKG